MGPCGQDHGELLRPSSAHPAATRHEQQRFARQSSSRHRPPRGSWQRHDGRAIGSHIGELDWSPSSKPDGAAIARRKRCAGSSKHRRAQMTDQHKQQRAAEPRGQAAMRQHLAGKRHVWKKELGSRPERNNHQPRPQYLLPAMGGKVPTTRRSEFSHNITHGYIHSYVERQEPSREHDRKSSIASRNHRLKGFLSQAGASRGSRLTGRGSWTAALLKAIARAAWAMCTGGDGRHRGRERPVW